MLKVKGKIIAAIGHWESNLNNGKKKATTFAKANAGHFITNIAAQVQPVSPGSPMSIPDQTTKATTPRPSATPSVGNPAQNVNPAQALRRFEQRLTKHEKESVTASDYGKTVVSVNNKTDTRPQRTKRSPSRFGCAWAY